MQYDAKCVVYATAVDSVLNAIIATLHKTLVDKSQCMAWEAVKHIPAWEAVKLIRIAQHWR